MAIILAILDFLFGCHHLQLGRVFTLQGETYGCAVTAARDLHIRWKPCRLSIASRSLLP
jgi:hypothetical protein